MKNNIDVKIIINKEVNEMADKFETHKHFRRWMWAVVICSTTILLIKYLPPLILAFK